MKSVVLVLVLALGLAGCTAETPAPEPTTPASTAPADTTLLPVTVDPATAEALQVEGTRVADGLQALMEGILYVDDNSAVAPGDAETASYYAVYRTITLEAAVDPLIMSAQLTTILEQSGWSIYETTNEGGQYLSALSSGDSGWFALIGGDATVDGQPVVTFQIASPDIQ